MCRRTSVFPFAAFIGAAAIRPITPMDLATTAHLKDQDIEVDFSQLTTPNDRIAIVATEPLTDNERWVQFSSRQLLVFHDGAPLSL